MSSIIDEAVNKAMSKALEKATSNFQKAIETQNQESFSKIQQQLEEILKFIHKPERNTNMKIQ